jgi:hypothetical protein
VVVKNKTLSSAEVGTLWMTFQQKTLILRTLEYFIEKSEDQQAKNIMGGLWQELTPLVEKIKKMFEDEGATVPSGFTKADVNLDAPKLYDNGFDIMFVRIFKELSMGMYSISMNMSYREDVISLYEDFTKATQKTYRLSTQYLLEKGILSPPPKVTMPKSNEIIESKNYLSGFTLFSEKRDLNDLEIGILHHGIEVNNIGMQLIMGFAQCTENEEVKQYFVQGKELAKKQIKIFEETLLQNDIQPTAAIGSTVTTSTISPFSEKLMMFCIYLLNGFGIVSNSFGTMFTLRNDLIMDSGLIVKDIFLYTNEGIKLMIKNGWMEEPPQMERSQ